MAQDVTTKRRNAATRAVAAADQLVEALDVLLSLKDERVYFAADFQDADFDTVPLRHLTAGMLGTLFDFVVPSMSTAFIDAGNSNRNKQILLQVRNSAG